MVGAWDLPEDFDWREASGVVGPALKQGHCGSCYAHAAVDMAAARARINSARNGQDGSGDEVSAEESQRIAEPPAWRARAPGCFGSARQRTTGDQMMSMH